MPLEQFLAQINQGEWIEFNDSLQIISEYYHYQPAAFHNGPVYNVAGQNEASCRIFAFARQHNLNVEQTLLLFGEHYRDVQRDPQGSGHANIRAFMQHGWTGIRFETQPLRWIGEG